MPSVATALLTRVKQWRKSNHGCYDKPSVKSSDFINILRDVERNRALFYCNKAMTRLVTPPSRRCRWPEQCQYLCWRYHKNRILLLDTNVVGLFETFPFITDFFTSLISGLVRFCLVLAFQLFPAAAHTLVA